MGEPSRFVKRKNPRLRFRFVSVRFVGKENPRLRFRFVALQVALQVRCFRVAGLLLVEDVVDCEGEGVWGVDPAGAAVAGPDFLVGACEA